MNPNQNTLLQPGDASATARFATLAEWLRYQENLHFTAMELGLERCREVAAAMGLLAPRHVVVSVAGTNGKGSCAAMLAAMYRNAGYRVGAYTSPHLTHYNERFHVDGREVPDEMLCAVFDRIDRIRGKVSLTYFEFGTLAAMEIFRAADVDVAVMEVGLGGRLDAVNVLDADAALIATVDLDHERWLGYDREAIGREKAGIFRAGRPAVCADTTPPDSVAGCARETGARLYQAGTDFHARMDNGTWSFRGPDLRLDALPKPSLYNDRQVQNAAGVLMVVDALSDRVPVPEEAIRASLRDFHLPGRFQIIPGEVPCILDVAHNPQAARLLVENLRRLPHSGETHMVVGMLRDKNHAAVLEIFADSADAWYLTSLGGERGAEVSQLVEAMHGVKTAREVRTFEQPELAMEAARARAKPGDRLVVTGSFLTVGAALRWLRAG